MNSTLLLILFCLFLLKITSSNSISIPVTKDPSTLQYLAQIKLGIAHTSIDFVLDLGGPLLWHVSSSGKPKPVQSGTIHCSLPNVNKDCSLNSENRITQLAGKGDLVEEILTVDRIIQPLLVSSAPDLLLTGLASTAKGILGFGRTRLSLPSQLAAVSHHQHKFALCLSSTDGVIVSGRANILDSLAYTPFIHRNDDYYITAKSVKVNGKRLSIEKSDIRISTIVPYTTMESRVYSVFIKAYALAADSMNLTQVESVSPFRLCFRSNRVRLPEIELVLQSEMVKWKISARNSMVKVSDEVICLGFTDGGLGLDSSIVIGGFQLEDNLLEFDLGTNMLGFSSSLLSRGTSCSKLGLDYMSSQVF